MRKNETVNTFSQEYDERIKSNKINECSWFGICLGLIMLAGGLYQSLCTVGLWCVFYKIICGIGLLLLLIGSFFPGVLNKPVHLIKNVFSVVGKYFLFYVPFLNEKKNKRIILDDEKNKKFKVFNGC